MVVSFTKYIAIFKGGILDQYTSDNRFFNGVRGALFGSKHMLPLAGNKIFGIKGM
jgi:hypothetical protein